MRVILIIAEKPSLARNIASALGAKTKRDGYLEGAGYLVTWAFGHLFSLCDIEDYTGATKTGRWSMENLPCFPEKFRFALRREKDGKGDEGVRRQFEKICALLQREDVDTVVNAGDADREGEIIVRRLLLEADWKKKPIKRLWLPDQTPETIRSATAEMRDASEYDLLAAEGEARTYMDWLYGVNLTRFATLKTGTLLRVGRVIVPIVKAIYDRDLAIENFEPEKYFIAQATLGEGEEAVEINSKKRFSAAERAKAEEYAARLSATPAVVTERHAKKENLNAGKLYSLSKLQNALGKKYKMTMDESLKLVQGLYEKGYVTYPRTNSEYLATAEKDKIRTILSQLEKLGYPVTFKEGKSIFDDGKIESHSALTPTFKIPSKEDLTEEEKKVYQAILRRFVAVFCREACLVEKTQITIAAAEEEFTLKGTVILEKGWTKFDDATRNDKLLPPLKKGDVLPLGFTVKEKETTPPKHHTIETLNNYLKNPFREEKARADEEEGDDAEDYKAMLEGLELGTEATRTGIIENAIHSQYIQLKKGVYSILPDGRYLIEQLSLMGIEMDKFKTATTGKILKSVFHGDKTVSDAVTFSQSEIAAVFERAEIESTGLYGDEIGTCPQCGGLVKKGKFSYGCENYKECAFRIPLAVCGRAIPVNQAKNLLAVRRSAYLEGFLSRRTGKTFRARLLLDENNKTVLDFEKR